MKTFRILGYLPEYGDGHWIDNAIDLWSYLFNLDAPKELRCSHIEIWFPFCLGENWWYRVDDNIVGECFTSTMRGKDNGVVMRPASTVLDHPDRWDYMEIEVSDAEYKRLYDRCRYRASLGLKYGKITFLRFFSPRWKYDEKKPICSGTCWANMWLCLNGSTPLCQCLTKMNVPSPTRLYYRIWKCGYASYSLATGKVVVEV